MGAAPPLRSLESAANREIVPDRLLTVADWVTTETARLVSAGAVLVGLDDTLDAHLPNWIHVLSDREIEFLLWAVEMGHREALEVTRKP